jgi:hypothetical protein
MLNWLRRLLGGDRSRDLLSEARRSGTSASSSAGATAASTGAKPTSGMAQNAPSSADHHVRRPGFWGPGLWGGLFAGGLLGSWFGTSAHAHDHHDHDHPNDPHHPMHDGSPPQDPDIWRGAGPGGGGSFNECGLDGGGDGGGDGSGGE